MKPDPSAAEVTKPHSILWWVLPVFLAIDAALLIPLKTIQWGYLGDLPLLITSFGVLCAQFAFLSAWTAMADIPWWMRLVGFALILVGVYGASLVLEDGGQQVFVTTACVSFAGAAALRLSGWRFQHVPRSERDAAGRMSWQFSLAELSGVMLGAGVLFGLLRWGGARWLQLDNSVERWLIIGTFSIGLFTSVAVGLISRRVWVAISVAVVGVPLGVFAVLMLVNQIASLVALVSLIAGGCLVPLILLARLLGIRLSQVAKDRDGRN